MERSDVEIDIDVIGCDGHGVCAELLPELIDTDDWGFPMVRRGPVPPELMPEARRAVSACPKLALRLQRCAPVG